MAQEIIDTGTSPNDGTGEPLRPAFEAINNNFSQIWSSGPVDTNVVIANNVVGINTINGNLILQGNGIGNVVINSHSRPSQDGIFDLGDPAFRFNTVYGQYFVGNGSQLTGITSYANTNVVAYGQAGWAGNIVPAANATYSLGNATNQWAELWVANATVYIGGVPLAVADNNTLTVNGQSVITFDHDCCMTNVGNFIFSNNELQNPNGGSFNNGDLSHGITAGFGVPANGNTAPANVFNTYGNVIVSAGSSAVVTATWTFDLTGNLVLPSNTSAIKYANGQPYGGSGNSLGNFIVTNNTFENAYGGSFDNGTAGTGATSRLSLPAASGNNSAMFENYYGNITIGTGTNGSAEKYWVFDTTGNLTLPANLWQVNYANGSPVALGGGGPAGLPLANGVSNFDIAAINGPATITVGGSATYTFNTDNLQAAGNVSGNVALFNNVNVNNVTANRILYSDANRNIYDTGFAYNSGADIISGSGAISTTGNITGGNLLTTGLVSTTGDVIANTVSALLGNITNINSLNLSVENISALVGNNGVNIGAGGYNNLLVLPTDVTVQNVPLSVQGNVNAGNLLTGGLISATGNVTGNYFVGNGSQLTGIYGNTNVANYLPTYTGNLVSLTGPVTTTANVTGGNITTAGIISTSSNVTGGNITTTGVVSASSNIIGGNITTAGIISTSSNVTGGNITTTGVVSATSDVTGGNITTTGTVSASSNVTGGNIVTIGVVSASGNVSGNYFLGNGALLTGIVTGYNDSNVASFLSSFGSNSISTTGTIQALAGNLINGDDQSSYGKIQLAFGYNGTTTYRHYIHTRHNDGSTVNNAIDFYTSDGNATGIFSANAIPGLTINGGKVGIGNQLSPAHTLDVNGNANVSGNIIGSKVITAPVTLASLTAVAGARAFVSDGNIAALANFGQPIGGGGANVVPVWSDGSIWYVG